MADKISWSDWGTGEGQSISVFDHILGKGYVHELLHGKSYQPEYDKIGKSLASSHGASQAALQSALGAIKSGYGGAQNAVNMGGAYATKQLLDREQRNLAGSQQSLISRGLYDTTAFDAAQRGVQSDTNDALANLNAQLAQIGSNINISQGRDVAGAYGNIAQEESQYAQMLLNLGLNTQYGEQGGSGAIVSGIIGSIFSDRRLKKNIEIVGLANGIPIYDYDFVDEAKIEGRWRGVLADEVEHLPGVVSVGSDGYKRVDYHKLGFDMKRVG